MRNTRWLLRPLSAACLLVALACLWVFFAPAQFGGQASYVIVAGASMKPQLQFGDLAIVRQTPLYQVGDVVTYRHPIAGPIIHRIIEQNGDRYILKGDANDWIDSHSPTQEEIIGKLWIHLPRLGRSLQKLRSPAWLTLISLMIAAGVFSSFQQRAGKRGSKPDPKPPSPKKGRSFLVRDGFEGLLFAVAVPTLASGILALLAFTRPATLVKEEALPYELRGAFRYTGQAPPGIYDGERISSGDPIYLQLTDEVEIDFQFELSSEWFSKAGGMIRLDAEISDLGGWKRLIELHPALPFSGHQAEIHGMIDLADLRAMTASLEERTGFRRSTYTLEVIPSVTSKARYNGNETLDYFEPRLTFRIEEFQMVLISTESGTSRLAQLEPRQTGYISQLVELQNAIPIFIWSLPVSAARWLSAIGLLISLAGIAALAISYLRAARDGEEARIGVKYGSMLVGVREGNFANGYHRVEVKAIEDLGRFAERVGGVILHEMRAEGHHYYVQEGNITYHYQTDSQKEGRLDPAHAPAGDLKTQSGKRSRSKKESRPAPEVTPTARKDSASTGELQEEDLLKLSAKAKSGKAKKPQQAVDPAAGMGKKGSGRRRKADEDA